MGRLAGKNILMVIPRDYFEEDELYIPMEIYQKEEANVLIASSKMKEAVGMHNGRQMPDRLVVDVIEGITGDSYVTGGTGTRQIKGIFHGITVVGGNGARMYLWKDDIVRLLLVDRHKSEFVVSAIGLGIGCLAAANLVENSEVAVDENDKKNKHLLKVLESGKALPSDEDVTVYNRVITGRGAEVAEKFAWTVVEEVSQITKMK